MSSIYFNPSEYIRNLQQLLVSDKKKIGFLFGAGTSLVNNPITKQAYVPAIKKMTELVEDKINKNVSYKTAIEEIKTELGDRYTVETLLSNLELKKQVIGTSIINGLKKSDVDELIKSIKDEIRDLVSIHATKDQIDIKNLVHTDFAEWIGKADRKCAVEIFTTNYDYLFEMGLEYKSIPYYDGFTGSYQPFFNGESVDDMSFLPTQTKLWKIHGSLGWHYDEAIKRILRKDSDSKDILIYPSTLKYDQSRKQPYTALGDRLTNFIKQDDTVLIVCGYSFGDEHINERINTALSSNHLSHVYVLYYDLERGEDGKKTSTLTIDCPMAKIASANRKISLFGSRSAVIGGVFGNWKLKREPDKDDSINIDLYYDEDAYNNLDDEKNKELKQVWSGEGELVLPDFSRFVYFLKKMVFPNITETGNHE